MRFGLGMTDPQTIHYGLWDGSSTILSAYVLVVIMICLKRKEFPRIFMLFIPSSLMLFIVLYFPHLSDFLVKIMPGTHAEYFQVLRRFRWIIMVLPTLSFGLTYAIQHTEKLQRIITTIIIFLLLFVSVYATDWTYKGVKTGFWDRGNTMNRLYKISNISVAIGDTVMDMSGDYLAENNRNYVTVLAVNDGTHGVRNDNRDALYFVRCARQYFSPIQCIEIDLSEENYERDITESKEYALCPCTPEVIEIFQNYGYSKVWNMDGYCFMTRRSVE